MTEIITWPRGDWGAIQRRFHLMPRSLIAEQPSTGVVSAYGPLSHLWVCDFTGPPKSERDWRRQTAVFSRLAGRTRLLRMGDPERTKPYYNVLNAPTEQAFSDATLFSDGTGWVEGLMSPTAVIGEAAEAEQEDLLVTGLPASLSPALYAGDLLEVQPNGVAARFGQLYEVYQDAPTDASGQTRVSINPALRKAVAAGDKVVLDHPTSVFRAVDDEQGIVETRPPSIGQLGFRLIEVPEET